MSSLGLRGAGIVGVPGVSISATTSSVGVCRTGTSSGVAIVSEVATANSSGTLCRRLALVVVVRPPLPQPPSLPPDFC